NIKTQHEKFRKAGIGTNVASFVGFGPVRQAILANDNRLPSATETEKMKQLVEKAMKEGAIGISTGLSYIPQNFSTTAELIELSKVVSKYGGTYDTHMRNQNTGSIKAIDENLEIGRKAYIPIHISHIKASGPAAHGMSTEIIQHIEQARKNGQNATASVYPYLAAGDDLNILIPTWANRTGQYQMLPNFNQPDSLLVIKDWINMRIKTLGGTDKLRLYCPNDTNYHVKTIADLVVKTNKRANDIVVEALTKYPSMEVHSFVMDENDLLNFIKTKWIATCSDGVHGHPRAAGSFTKKIRTYVLDKKLISMKFAIYTSTGLTADYCKLKHRGYIKEGNYADLVIFDPKTIKDNATYSNPYELANGIDYVIINGKSAIENRKYNRKLLGRTLKL
ncbi:N-acyl-D-amino-acid deacylase family protein, partial [Pedobacter sp.]